MNKKIDFHTVSICMLSVLGGTIVYAPCQNEKYSCIALAAALALGTPLYIFFLSMLNRIEFFRSPSKHKISSAIILLLLLPIGALSFASVTDYFSEAVLIKTPFTAVFLSLLAAVISAALCSGDAAKKAALPLAAGVSAVVLFIFIISYSRLDFSAASYVKGDGHFLKTFMRYVVSVFFFSLCGVFFQKKDDGLIDIKSTCIGTLAGGIILLASVVNSVSVLGILPASHLKFPYHFAVETFSAGTLFTRMDGFAYFALFACGFIKMFVCICAARNVVALKEKRKTLFSVCFCTAFSLLSLLF